MDPELSLADGPYIWVHVGSSVRVDDCRFAPGVVAIELSPFADHATVKNCHFEQDGDRPCIEITGAYDGQGRAYDTMQMITFQCTGNEHFVWDSGWLNGGPLPSHRCTIKNNSIGNDKKGIDPNKVYINCNM